MTKEEKLEEAKRLYKTANADQKYVLERLFPELKESEDEKIRKNIIATIHLYYGEPLDDEAKEMIAWLEKEGEHARFIEAIQVGDQVTKNEDGVLVNLSQLNRVAKKQGEQKPADKVEPKFKVGDWVVRNGETLQISGIDTVLDGTFHYWFTKGTWLSSKKMGNAMIWTIQDAKAGDVLVNGSNIFIFHFSNATRLMGYCHVNTDNGRFYDDIGKNECFCLIDGVVTPATKEQRDTLERAMTNAGYRWNKEELKLEKI